MLAVAAAACFLLEALDVHVDDLEWVPLGLLLLALHLVVPVAFPRRP